MHMTTRLFFSAALGVTALVCGSTYAQSAIYKCVDAQGRVEFTDVVKTGCKALDLPGSIAAPTRRAGASARQGSAPAPVATPANFPRVDTSVQKARDDDRRGILNEELRAEEKKLSDLKGPANGSDPVRMASMKDDINRAERNIDALRREISNIR
ncbi:MAG: DUF4124 domain-containing protein [Pseudomonadota bacterium]|nr:DUF4124 domain-containing protein [Pseudomonadota bacterium]